MSGTAFFTLAATVSRLLPFAGVVTRIVPSGISQTIRISAQAVGSCTVRTVRSDTVGSAKNDIDLVLIHAYGAQA